VPYTFESRQDDGASRHKPLERSSREALRQMEEALLPKPSGHHHYDRRRGGGGAASISKRGQRPRRAEEGTATCRSPSPSRPAESSTAPLLLATTVGQEKRGGAALLHHREDDDDNGLLGAALVGCIMAGFNRRNMATAEATLRSRFGRSDPRYPPETGIKHTTA
jgi:hypothetical protein